MPMLLAGSRLCPASPALAVADVCIYTDSFLLAYSLNIFVHFLCVRGCGRRRGGAGEPRPQPGMLQREATMPQVNRDHYAKLKQLFALRNPAAQPGDDDTAVRPATTSPVCLGVVDASSLEILRHPPRCWRSACSAVLCRYSLCSRATPRSKVRQSPRSTPPVAPGYPRQSPGVPAWL